MSGTLGNMLWAFAGRMSMKVVQFAFSIFLARFLCPHDFGLVGMLTIFTGLADVFMDCGLTAALIRKQDRKEADYSTVFWGKLAIASLCYVLLFAAAPQIAAFYGQPQLTDIVRVVTLGLLPVSLTAVAQVRLEIEGRFRSIATTSIVSVLLSGVVGAMCAWYGLGVWAVVLQGLAWHVVQLALMLACTRWIPSAEFSVKSYREFLGFGWKHLMRGVLDVVYGNAYSVVIGKCFGAADLGLYNRANYYATEPGGLVGGVVNEVNYPILSSMQDDNAKLRSAYRRLQLIVATIMIPGMAVLALFAEPLVRFVIGEQWLGCVPCLRVLAVGAALSPLAGLAYMPMYIKGRTDLALKLELFEKPFAFALLLGSIPFGILAICTAKSLSAIVFFAVNTSASRRMLHDSCRARKPVDGNGRN